MNIEIEKLDQETQRAMIYVCERAGIKPSQALIALLEQVRFDDEHIERATIEVYFAKSQQTESPLP